MTLKEKLMKKSNLWHVGAIALFLAVSCIFFYPALQGYSVDQSDVKFWAGAAQEVKDYKGDGDQIMWTNSMFSGMPSTQIMMEYGGRQIPEFFRGALRLWLPVPIAILFVYFLGFYLMALSFKIKPMISTIGAIAYGFSSYFIIILEVGHVTKALAIGYAPLVVAGFIMAYRNKNWILGLGLSSLFMTFLLIANHVQIVYYLAFVLIALGIVELRRYLKEEGGIMKFVKVSVGLLVAYGLALMVNIGNIQGSAEYADYTMRGGTDLTINADGSANDSKTTDGGLDRDYITHWSYGKAETFTFLVPNFKGGKSAPLGNLESNEDMIKDVDGPYRQFVAQQMQYFGDQPITSGGVYVGAIVFLLAILALFYSDKKSKWALFAVTMLVIMLSWGKNFMFLTDLFLDFFPGYNKFRAITIILVIAELCIPLLGIFFLQKLYTAREEIKKNIKPFLIVSGSVVLLLLLFLAMPTVFNTFLSIGEQDAIAGIADPAQYETYNTIFTDVENIRISMFRADVGRSLFFVLAGVALMYFYIQDKLKANVMLIGIGLLTLIDLGMVNKRFLGTEEKGKGYEQWVETYKQQYPYTAGAGENQILSLEMQENPALLFKVDSAVKEMESTFDKEMSGSEKQRLRDWATFRTLNRNSNFRVMEEGNLTSGTYTSYFFKSIGGYHGAKLGRYQELIEFHLANNNPSVMDMLNLKYIIRPQRDASGNITNSSLLKANTTAMGNVWFTKKVDRVQTADEEILALNSAHNYIVSQSGEFRNLVNGQTPSDNQEVTPRDQIAILFPSQFDSTGSSFDTIPVQQIPWQAAEQLPLTWFLDSMGQAQWNYDMYLDSNTMKLLTISYAGRKGWDPNKSTVYRGDGLKDSYTGEGEIAMTSYSPDYMTYKSNSSSEQLAVFSEIYYPIGWKAYIDNKEVDILSVNYALRGVEVPAGEHTIELVFELDSYASSSTMAWIGSVLMFLLIGFGAFMGYKNMSNEELKAEVIDDSKEA